MEEAGEEATARRLRKMLEETDHQLHPSNVSFARSLPVDTESRFPLIELVNPKEIKEPPVILTEGQWIIVHEFLSVAKSYALLEAEGIHGPVSFLMYGPPGTGKSRLARFIAQELTLDLYIARLDGLISSFLGSTSKNIRALFDFAARTPCILFLDEFDAIAKLRGDSQELGELKRVVNSFIQNLDALGAQSIILAATNHEGLLDSAIWRRFSYRLEFAFPTESLRRPMWSEFLKPFDYSERELDLLVDLSEGFTGSDIQEVCRRLHRRRITSQTTPEMRDSFEILRNIAIGEGEERRFLSGLKGLEPPAIASALRTRKEKLYSYATLGDLLGTSKSTVMRWIKEGDNQNG